jgi:hypothetical protein
VQAHDTHQQTAWRAVREGSTKKGFNILTSSSSLLLIARSATDVQTVAIAPLIINAFDGPNGPQNACNHD